MLERMILRIGLTELYLSLTLHTSRSRLRARLRIKPSALTAGRDKSLKQLA
jgi:hypothetical protein